MVRVAPPTGPDGQRHQKEAGEARPPPAAPYEEAERNEDDGDPEREGLANVPRRSREVTGEARGRVRGEDHERFEAQPQGGPVDVSPCVRPQPLAQVGEARGPFGRKIRSVGDRQPRQRQSDGASGQAGPLEHEATEDDRDQA